MIERSNDSYIIKLSKSLLETYSQFAAEVRMLSETCFGQGLRFFSNKVEKDLDQVDAQIDLWFSIPFLFYSFIRCQRS